MAGDVAGCTEKAKKRESILCISQAVHAVLLLSKGHSFGLQLLAHYKSHAFSHLQPPDGLR